MDEKMRAYHFLKSDFTAGEGFEPCWQIGETRTVTKPSRIKLCKYGYHSSPTLWDALQYAPGPLACLVEVSELVQRDDDKFVSASRALIAAVNIERELRLFACDCAERVLHIFEAAHSGDTRPHQAVATARKFANGLATTEELDAAQAAANAARDAADAAWAAAQAAADAAWAAAQAAAWAAANAARDAAQAAAWDAAAAADAAQAAANAARDAESAWQKQHFIEMFEGIFND